MKSKCFVVVDRIRAMSIPALCLSIAAVLALAVQLNAGQNAQKDPPLTNQDVAQMVSVGLSEGVIVDSIHAARATNFDISVGALQSLKAQHIPDAVIQAMIQVTGSARASEEKAAELAASRPDPNNPASPHDAGFWVVVGGQMKQIDATTFGETKMGTGAGMMLPGGKSHSTAALRGAHAELQLSDPSPVFYLYFDKEGGAVSFASMTNPTPTSPNQFQLVRMEVKKDSRVMITSTMSSFGGMQQGPDKKDVMDFTATKIASGIYKVTPNRPLEAGEYVFAPSGGGMAGMMMGGGGTIYDFGIGHSN
jgi:hypothetical protein